MSGLSSTSRPAKRPKTSLYLVLREEIEQAADWWDEDVKVHIIAQRLNWSFDLLVQVMRISRECGEDYFLPLRQRRAARLAAYRSSPQAQAMHANSQRGSSQPRYTAWRERLAADQVSGTTVKARRPGDYVTTRFVDPTVSIPPSQTAQTMRAAPLSADHVPSVAASRSADVLFRRGR